MTIVCTPTTLSSLHPDTKDFIKNMTTGALQSDMTLVMVCVCTRPTVQKRDDRASDGRREGEAVDDARELCATA